MLTRGLLPETADLLVRGMLDPASPAGRAIGYRQAIEFLIQEAQLVEAEEARENTGVSSEEVATDDASGSRRSSGGDGGKRASVADPETRFLDFVLSFAAKTRQYSGEQMKWFRSSKGRDFSWQAWDLGGPIEEVRRAGRRSSRANTHGGATPAVTPGSARAGDGCDRRDVATSIAERFELSRGEFENDLNGEYQASLRSENRKRAGDMKRYVTGLSLLGGDGDNNDVLQRLVRETKELATRLRQAEPERFRDGDRMVELQGWHAGNR